MSYPETTQLNRQFNRPAIHWQDWLNVLLAIWLFISPWVLNFGGVVDGGGGAGVQAAIAITAAWNAWVLGVIVFLLSLTAVRQHSPNPEWINVLLGAWIFIAPWILGFYGFPVAAWDHWVVGAVIFILAIWSLSSPATTTGVPAE